MLPMNLTGLVLAAIAPGDSGLAVLGAALGCGLAVLGAGLGIGLIGSKALDGTARQPEVGDKLFRTMIVAAALVESVALIALLFCLLAINWFR
jgi:F-type H+-transporting ATPase subunit c